MKRVIESQLKLGLQSRDRSKADKTAASDLILGVEQLAVIESAQGEEQSKQAIFVLSDTDQAELSAFYFGDLTKDSKRFQVDDHTISLWSEILSFYSLRHPTLAELLRRRLLRRARQSLLPRAILALTN